MFYVGKEFDLKKNKEYKSIKSAKEAARKAGLNVFDEVGELAASYEIQAEADQIAEEDIQEAAGTGQEEQEAGKETPKEEGTENLPPDSVEPVKGKIQRVFAGKLRIRRAPSEDPAAVCGVSLFDKKRVTERHTVSGKVWYKTMDGYFISGDPEHVKFEEE